LTNSFDYDLTRRIELFGLGVRRRCEYNRAVGREPTPQFVEVDLNAAGLG
jgi:hypothetical protein